MVFFAAYTPLQKTDWIFFAPLRRRELCETFLNKRTGRSEVPPKKLDNILK